MKNLTNMTNQELEATEQAVSDALWKSYLASIAHDPQKLRELVTALEADQKAAREATREAEALQALGMKQ